jgi:anti-anti-sigma factor
MQSQILSDVSIESHADGTTVASLSGRLDLLSAIDVKRRLAETITDGQRTIVVDLQAVTFIDSSGLGALIGALKAARLAGGDLRIARPQEQARVILQLTTLDRVLRPYTTVEEALRGFNN